jgi:protein-S-isoprenylcysteine O-methyltransferase Ste14
MIAEVVSAIMLVLPLSTMIIPSISYWSEFKKEKKGRGHGRKAHYNKLFFYLFVAGVLGMWIAWIGGIIVLFLNKYYSTLEWLTVSTPYKATIQIIGFLVFYIGALIYNMNIIIAGKYLRPAPSGTLENHRLIKKGPFAIIRHPLYVSYVLILTGLGFILLSYWLLIPALFLIIGIYPTAKAEEKVLIEQFGDEYIKYQQKVGMFFPKC